jgi:hypothetical protein
MIKAALTCCQLLPLLGFCGQNKSFSAILLQGITSHTGIAKSAFYAKGSVQKSC